MDDRKMNEIASELDDLIVDVEELKEGADDSVGDDLDTTQAALERAREALDEADDAGDGE